MTNEFLNKMSQVVFMVTCVALVALAGIKVWDDRSRTMQPGADDPFRNPAAQGSVLPVGSQLQPIDGISFSKSPLTVALVLQSGCPYCTESMGFYKRISELRAANKFQLVALSTEPTEITKDYLGKHGLVVDSVASLKGPEVPTTGTPTLVLVTDKGTVGASWIGQLNQAQEKDVMQQIQEATKPVRSS